MPGTGGVNDQASALQVLDDPLSMALTPETGASVCDMCTQGKYMERFEASACLDCGLGTHNPHLAVASSTGCLDCQAGRYGDTIGAAQ